MNIYLDINGVLLNNKGEIPDFGEVFLQYILTRWPDNTYWLTSHCWKGNNNATELIKSKLKKKRTIQLIELVQPSNWDELKTDAIDFSHPFLWFDDNLFPDESQILNHYHALACHRKIDLLADPSQLYNETVYLKSLA